MLRSRNARSSAVSAFDQSLADCDRFCLHGLVQSKGERFVTVITGALAVWDVGIAFAVGMAAYALNKRGWLRV